MDADLDDLRDRVMYRDACAKKRDPQAKAILTEAGRTELCVHFACVVCKDVLIRPLTWRCGHAVCGVCHHNLAHHACPECDADGPAHHNAALERVIDLLVPDVVDKRVRAEWMEAHRKAVLKEATAIVDSHRKALDDAAAKIALAAAELVRTKESVDIAHKQVDARIKDIDATIAQKVDEEAALRATETRAELRKEFAKRVAKMEENKKKEIETALQYIDAECKKTKQELQARYEAKIAQLTDEKGKSKDGVIIESDSDSDDDDNNNNKTDAWETSRVGDAQPDTHSVGISSDALMGVVNKLINADMSAQYASASTSATATTFATTTATTATESVATLTTEADTATAAADESAGAPAPSVGCGAGTAPLAHIIPQYKDESE